MLFKFVHRFKHVFFWVYIFFAAALIAALGYVAYYQADCELKCSATGFNPSSYLVPIIAYLSIGLVAITIGFTRKTASEKNALDFAKELGLLTPHMKALGEIRKGMLQNDGELNRRKAAEYMASLSDLTDPTADGHSKATDANGPSNPGANTTSAEQPPSDTTAPKTDEPAAHAQATQGNQDNPDAGAQVDDAAKASDATKATETAKSAATAPQTQAELDWNNRLSAFALLNALESCANAVRYEIYDEDFIYNIYGSHFIEWYELCYGLIKRRQRKQERVWVNFEWLAVKWTLRHNITGVISNESRQTSYIINEALQALKSHNRTRPIQSKLKKFEKQLKRRKFPM
ncbi:DUF4760 domain-containing protein [Pseudomonas putida]|uniref:DUF4760 domain-containing protein n=1 Tax=Pseudomonas putida TaxID=303 RepID=UPI00300F7664